MWSDLVEDARRAPSPHNTQAWLVEIDDDHRARVFSRAERLLPVEDPDYRARYAAVADRTFPVRDGRNSERVVEAITAMSRRIPFDEAARAAIPDAWPSPADEAPTVSHAEATARGPRPSEVEAAGAG